MDWKTCKTLGKQKKFRYSGEVRSRVVLDQSGHPQIDARFFTAALKHFSGQTVRGGFKEDDPPPGGFGEWVQNESPRLNSRKLTPRHGSFMAAILCQEAGVESSLEDNAVVLRFPKAHSE